MQSWLHSKSLLVITEILNQLEISEQSWSQPPPRSQNPNAKVDIRKAKKHNQVWILYRFEQTHRITLFKESGADVDKPYFTSQIELSQQNPSRKDEINENAGTELKKFKLQIQEDKYM